MILNALLAWHNYPHPNYTSITTMLPLPLLIFRPSILFALRSFDLSILHFYSISPQPHLIRLRVDIPVFIFLSFTSLNHSNVSHTVPYHISSYLFLSAEMARAAYYGGADFFYRVNDDTELMNKWALTFVSAIDSLPLPGGELNTFN